MLPVGKMGRIKPAKKVLHTEKSSFLRHPAGCNLLLYPAFFLKSVGYLEKLGSLFKIKARMEILTQAYS